MRRLVRPMLAFCVLLMLFTVATCTVVSLALAGFNEAPPQASANASAPVRSAHPKAHRAPAAASAPAPSPDGFAPDWPDANFPASSSAADGDVAAGTIAHFQPQFATVSQVPDWGAPFDGVVEGVDTGRKVVALTIDDGPSENTMDVIDQLAQYGDRATMFWVGARITTEAAEFARANGDEIGNHTWNHPNMGLLNSAEASAEIGLTSARIAQVTGTPPVWFRSPYNRLFAPELQQVRGHGLLYANYDITSVDWIDSMSIHDVLGSVGEGLKPGGVILMHDSPGRAPKALHAVLQLLADRGYEVVTLSELARMGAPVQGPLRLGAKGLGM